MADIRWVDKHIEVTPPKHPKKITGTRMAGIFGLNKWVTPFRMWCEITKTWEQPFVSTKYTEAGKVIEPKQAAYMVDAYGMTNLRTPTDIFGPDYFKTTYGDFFHGVNVATQNEFGNQGRIQQNFYRCNAAFATFFWNKSL